MSNKKIGFWAVFSIVIGSQIGSGVFLLPATLAPYGVYSIVGWIISSVGAIALCFVFSALCARFPKTGGPHVYVSQAFGPEASFFTGWTYWIISWVSTTAVVVACVGYLGPFFGPHSSSFYLSLEILLLFSITILNLKGVELAGKAEFILTILKIFPLLVIPVIAFYAYDAKNFILDARISTCTTTEILGQVTLITLWGFIGLEAATTPAGSVENPKKTIPKAIIAGTVTSAIVYILNTFAIMGLIPGSELMLSKAPYVDASRILFSGQWHLLIAFISSIVCIGTLNAWMLASGQIVLGLAEDGLMPKLFMKKNNDNAPIWGLLASSLGIVPLLVLTASDSIAQQVILIIEFSVTAFLFVYLICSLSLVKLMLKREVESHYWLWLFTVCSIIFCLWVLYETPVKTLIIASLFTLSGVPIYLGWYCKNSYPKTLMTK